MPASRSLFAALGPFRTSRRYALRRPVFPSAPRRYAPRRPADTFLLWLSTPPGWSLAQDWDE
jgi:hypothetical protein